VAKAFALVEEGKGNISITGHGQRVGVIGDEVVEAFGDEEDLVVAHVGARAAIGVKLGGLDVFSRAIVGVVVESGGHDTGAGLSDGRHFHGGQVVIDQDSLHDKREIGGEELGQALGQQRPESIVGGGSQLLLERDESLECITLGWRIQAGQFVLEASVSMLEDVLRAMMGEAYGVSVGERWFHGGDVGPCGLLLYVESVEHACMQRIRCDASIRNGRVRQSRGVCREGGRARGEELVRVRGCVEVEVELR
jgi:hypothetical protein